MGPRTVIIITDLKTGSILRPYTVPTAQINPRDKKDIRDLAAKYQQIAYFYELEGWSGIESVKWDIKEMNGDT